MSPSPSSSVRAAREALAARLREIRLDAGITGRELAARAGWSESKSSRIENSKTPPSDADIRAWCRVCDAENQSADLIAANRTADSMYVQWRRVQRTGLSRAHAASIPLYEETQHFRVYCSNVVPGLFQTPEYATALLSSIVAFRKTPNDVADAVAARMARSHVIREGNHRFAVLVEESVLRYRVGDPEVMAGQLGHLIAVMALPAVSLGVIPFTAKRDIWPLETFSVFDDRRVHIELLSAAVTVTEPGEVSQYVDGFGELTAIAVHGAAARSLITAAIDALK
ncbi:MULTISPECIES: helix-turn-helix domain-containing protein [unclassified Streptomyces]|uniref:helix-turn-helix domain-containing protein n=1 Tax=unclassified Streptomyces TaxID=2593676 RepID=UPI002033C521|nr:MULTISPECIES: helix-turn-helix transcriptional regulator [unclassified Streptomyces]MCM2420076.1 helix-turn-helix transcriptional regulator [Streptomyces sp. RKAG293]MCM2427728.1 helix-turn-helix transcriptional regulator [Streptomyces sp. RKAG337]